MEKIQEDIGKDCNRNSVRDEDELSLKEGKDCVSDSCVFATDFLTLPPECLSCKSHDIDGDGVPDQCQDCNNNLIGDPSEIRDNPSLDKNNNGRPCARVVTDLSDANRDA